MRPQDSGGAELCRSPRCGVIENLRSKHSFERRRPQNCEVNGILLNMVNPSQGPTRSDRNDWHCPLSVMEAKASLGLYKPVFLHILPMGFPNRWSHQLNVAKWCLYASLNWIRFESGNGLVSIEWNFERNSHIPFDKNAFGNAVCKIVTTLFWFQ